MNRLTIWLISVLFIVGISSLLYVLYSPEVQLKTDHIDVISKNDDSLKVESTAELNTIPAPITDKNDCELQLDKNTPIYLADRNYHRGKKPIFLNPNSAVSSIDKFYQEWVNNDDRLTSTGKQLFKRFTDGSRTQGLYNVFAHMSFIKKPLTHPYKSFTRSSNILADELFDKLSTVTKAGSYIELTEVLFTINQQAFETEYLITPNRTALLVELLALADDNFSEEILRAFRQAGINVTFSHLANATEYGLAIEKIEQMLTYYKEDLNHIFGNYSHYNLVTFAASNNNHELSMFWYKKGVEAFVDLTVGSPIDMLTENALRKKNQASGGNDERALPSQIALKANEQQYSHADTKDLIQTYSDLGMQSVHPKTEKSLEELAYRINDINYSLPLLYTKNEAFAVDELLNHLIVNIAPDLNIDTNTTICKKEVLARIAASNARHKLRRKLHASKILKIGQEYADDIKDQYFSRNIDQQTVIALLEGYENIASKRVLSMIYSEQREELEYKRFSRLFVDEHEEEFSAIYEQTKYLNLSEALELIDQHPLNDFEFMSYLKMHLILEKNGALVDIMVENEKQKIEGKEAYHSDFLKTAIKNDSWTHIKIFENYHKNSGAEPLDLLSIAAMANSKNVLNNYLKSGYTLNSYSSTGLDALDYALGKYSFLKDNPEVVETILSHDITLEYSHRQYLASIYITQPQLVQGWIDTYDLDIDPESLLDEFPTD